MDISQVCNLCNKQNDQMLMLKCVHDPCINCAATTYAQQIHIKGQSNQVYVCQICGQQTVLDGTTVSQLSNLANSYVKSPSKTYGKRATNQSIQSVQQTRKIQPTSHKLQSNSQSTKKVIYYCKDHQQEEVTYYCFNCGENICPECAIHGRHKDHSVKMIKKAIAQVKNDYMEKIGKLTNFQNSIVRGKDNFLRIIKSTNDRHIRQKHIISKQFQTMRSSLVMKQKQLLKQLDDVNRSNIQTLTSILQQVNKNYQQSNKVKKTIQSILKYDQVLILQQYKQISTFQISIKQLSNLTDSIGGKVHALNGEYLVEQVKALAEELKKVNLKLEEEKVGLLEAMEINNNNTVTSGFRDRDR